MSKNDSFVSFDVVSLFRKVAVDEVLQLLIDKSRRTISFSTCVRLPTFSCNKVSLANHWKGFLWAHVYLHVCPIYTWSSFEKVVVEDVTLKLKT